MSGWRVWLLVLLLAAGFTWGMLRLFGVQYATGDVYPEYSSLRSDPLGARLLYESLTRLPGLHVTRNFLPLEYFSGKPSTVLLLGVKPPLLKEAEFVRPIERVAGRGHRVVIGVTNLAEARAIKLDKSLQLADTDLFANAPVLELKRLAAVTAALGSNPSIVFDESHFGIMESGSVVGLARRYHLLGLALGLAICAALALWRNASPFPPRGETFEPERLSGRTSFAGLVTLLRRHIPADRVTSVCWQEWFKTNRREMSPSRVRRAEALAASAGARPLEAVREISAVVRAKGEL